MCVHAGLCRPVRRPQLFSLPEVRALVPPVVLFHGTCDVSCPAVFSTHFAAELRKCGVPVRLEYSPGKSHTDYILEVLLCCIPLRLDVT